MCEVSLVLKNLGALLEGPHWDSSTSTLLFVDIHGKKIHRYDPESEKLETLTLEDTVSAVVPCESGGLLACMGRKIVRLPSWDSRAVSTIIEVDGDRPTNRFNDAKCDPAGRFWAGTMGKETKPAVVEIDHGRVYCLDPKSPSDARVVREKTSISNGMSWTSDRKIFFYIDSLSHGVDAYDYDADTGKISNLRKVVKIPEEDGIPDGMCIDDQDMIWVAMYSGGQVIRYNPKTGEKMSSFKVPGAKYVTSCCFGGKDLDVMYLTTTKCGKEAEPLDGSLFKATNLGVRGLPGACYKA